MMKTSKKFIALLSGAVLLTSSAFAQTVATDPVGYVTAEIPMHTGGSSTLALVNLSLLPASEFAGSAATISGAQLNLGSALLSSSQFDATDANGLPLYHVEFTSGIDSEGLTVGIASNATDSITLSEDVSSILTDGVTILVRKFSTLADVFGSDNSLYSLGEAGNANDADVVYLEDNAGSIARYYYQAAPPFAGGSGWRIAGDTGTDQSNVRINWNAILISRNGSATRPAISLVNSGTVQIGKAVSTINTGLNIVGYQFPVNLTLNTLGFDTSDLQSGSSANDSDVVYLLNAGALTRYYYQTAPPFAGGTGWRIAGDTGTDQSGVTVAPDAAVLVLRRGVAPIYMSAAQPF
jgi:hypothetical protein